MSTGSQRGRMRPELGGSAERGRTRRRSDPRRRSSFTSRVGRQLVLLVSLSGTAVPAALAQSQPWSVQVGAARSDVSLGAADVVWGTDRAQITFQDPTSGGFHVAFVRERRDQRVDHVVVGGAHRRLGDWTLGGRLGVAPEPQFYYRHMVEAGVSRRLVGGLVGTFAYRYLDFPTATVRIAQPAASYYFPGGEIAGRVYLTRNDALGVDSTAYSLRGIWRAGPRWRVSVGGAVGERIFDITSLVEEPAEGWIAFADVRLALTEKDAVGVLLELAHEEPSFDKRGLGLYYRRSF